MAELLDKLLENPDKFEHITRLLSDPTPPDGIDGHTWLYKEELPLHLINYLRDQTSKILSENLCKQTPNKLKSTTKYNYNSPVKSVRKEPVKKVRKEKKKIKLFPADKVTSGTASSQQRSSNIDLAAETDGVGPIDKVGLKQRTPPSTSNLTAITQKENSNNSKHRKKQSPSPQPLSLSDFISLDSCSGSRRGSAGRSPKKTKTRTKCSTPLNSENFLSRLDRVEEDKDKCYKITFGKEENNINIESKEIFPEIGQLGVEKKRRIKPICVNNAAARNSGFGMLKSRAGSGGGSSQFDVAEVDRNTVDDRQQMVQEAANLTPFKGGNQAPSGGGLASGGGVHTPVFNSIITPIKGTSSMVTPIKSNSVLALNRSLSMVSPAPEKVTNRTKLDLLINLYSYVILNNLMPNYTVEVYFLLELLQVEISMACEKQEALSVEDLSNLFCSVHNCVYFSVKVMEYIHQTFHCFDRSTIKLLSDNTRIQLFSAKLTSILEDLIEGFSSTSPLKTRGPSAVKNVSFQTETDNRSNFPSTSSFQDFKKQRDKFYALIRSWQELSRGKDYDFSVVFGAQVDDILKMYPHPVNYSHFCSLFLHQMLAMCRGEDPGPLQTRQARQGHAQDDLSLLKTLDPVKYARLAVRLVTPAQLGGPCPPPSFIGAQEFFRDFVLSCNSPRFLVHLKNTLVSEILKQEAIYMGRGEEEISLLSKSDTADIIAQQDKSGSLYETGEGDESNHQLIHDAILSLRLLAKFLGFLEFMPYVFSDNEAKSSLAVVDSVIENRKACVAPIDLKEILSTAESTGRLVVTLPWVLEYLAQMDPLGYSLQYYKHIATKIVQIYQNLLRPSLDKGLASSVAFFLSVYTGWLLEKADFPRDLIVLARFEPYSYLNQDEFSIDRTFFVSQSLFHQCCPWFNEIKVLLNTASNLGSNLPTDKEGYKKITPISAPQKSTVDKARLVQANLEENFLNNQPSSLRRTIEFLSERLTSNTTKIVRNHYMPEKRRGVYQIIHQSYKTIQSKDLEMMSRDSVETVTELINQYISTKCEEDTMTTLDLLLSEDIHPSAKGVCTEIVVRNVRDKVDQWSKQNLTNQFFINEYQGELDRVVKAAEKQKPKQLEPKDLLIEHNPAAPHPSKLIIQMKSDLIYLLNPNNSRQNGTLPDQRSSLADHEAAAGHSEGHEDGGPELTAQMILECVQHRSDLTTIGIHGLGSLSVDWIISLISRRPELVSQLLIQSLIRIWRLLVPVQLLTILSPTSILILSHSNRIQLSWQKMNELIWNLYQEKLLPSLALEDACLDLLTQDVVSLEYVLKCLEYLEQRDTLADFSWIYTWKLEYQAVTGNYVLIEDQLVPGGVDDNLNKSDKYDLNTIENTDIELIVSDATRTEHSEVKDVLGKDNIDELNGENSEDFAAENLAARNMFAQILNGYLDEKCKNDQD